MEAFLPAMRRGEDSRADLRRHDGAGRRIAGRRRHRARRLPPSASRSSGGQVPATADRRGATRVALAGRNDRGAAAQAEHLVRGAWLVSEVLHAGSQTRDPAAPARARDVRRRLSTLHVRTADARLAQRRLRGGSPRRRVREQCGAFSRAGEPDMNLDLDGKVAIVGGASQGIGYGIARMLAREGAAVAITARREADLQAAAVRLRADTGANVLPIQGDCRRADDCVRVAEVARRELGGIDVLINNDGAPPLGPVLSFDDAAWAKAVEQNLMYVVRMAREVVPSMKERGGGGILNITAISAIQPIPGFALSVATWSAVIGYAKTLSLEVAPFGINVNTICPGYVDTTRLQKVFAAGGEDANVVKARLTDEIPMKRIGTVDDIASLAALLVSPKGRYVTGTAIQVDGGLLRATR